MINRRLALVAAVMAPTAAWAGWPWGFGDEPLGGKPEAPPKTTHSDGIHVLDGPQDQLKFIRIYVVDLPRNLTGKITCSSTPYSSLFPPDGRQFNCEVTQPDGNGIAFEKDKIAEKIVQADLLDPLKAFCRRVEEIDAAYMATPPDHFVDADGATWKRVKAA